MMICFSISDEFYFKTPPEMWRGSFFVSFLCDQDSVQHHRKATHNQEHVIGEEAPDQQGQTDAVPGDNSLVIQQEQPLLRAAGPG